MLTARLSFASPFSAASISCASAPAIRETAARSASPSGRGDSNRTAAVPATDASHQPARRSGIIATVPGEAAGST